MNDTVILLRDGAEAFPEILSCIRAAEQSIEVNMFIWRDDQIGRRVAEELLKAADRGVRIRIVKDRYGVICEYCEEAQRSLFHPYLSLSERVSVRALELFYNRDLLGLERAGEQSPLLNKLLQHPNFCIRSDSRRYDHSKYYIFDEKILILGGINIEDKEDGMDRAGRHYRDFMVELVGENFVTSFRGRQNGLLSEESACFALNVKDPVRLFEIKQRYIDLIRDAAQELTIVMAYLTPFRPIMAAIRDAARRGVRIRILIPRHANFMDDLNRHTASQLLRFAEKTHADLKIYLSPDMVHAKALMSEKSIIVGSCNITRNAFHTLSELNYEAARDDSKFAADMQYSISGLFQNACQARTVQDLKYRRWKLLLERIMM